MQGVFAAVVGISMLSLGLAGLASPDAIAGLIEMHPRSNSAYSEIRGMYGGIHAALGLFILGSVQRPAWRLSALYIIALMSFGYCLGRLTSLLLDGPPGATVIAAATLELTLGVIALYFVVRSPHPANR